MSTGLRVLIVEENPAHVHLWKKQLCRAGFEPTCKRVETEEEFAAALMNDPQLILSEYLITEFGARGALQVLRERRLDIPLVVISAHTDESEIAAIIQAGAEDYLLKDRLERLGTVVTNALDRRRLRRSEATSLKLLRDSEARLQSAFEQAAVGVGHVALDRRWILVNSMLCDMLGYSREELLQMRKEDTLRGGDAEYALKQRANLLDGSASSYMAERQFMRKDGSILSASVATSLARDEANEPKCFIVVVEHLSARQESETRERERTTLREAIAAMQQVLGVVAHEMRTPLAGLRAISELLLTDQTSVEQRTTFITRMHEEVVKLSDTVNELLEAARLNSGRVNWNWGKVKLRDIGVQAVESIRSLVDEKLVRLVLEIDPPEAEMDGDPHAIGRLILNLLSNAAKHTTDGEIEVRIKMDSRFSAEQWVNISVRDTGEGIPAKIFPQLGQAFALNRGVVGAGHVNGSGVGLSVCKGIVEAHGGTMSVESNPGEGTTVTAHLRANLSQPATIRGKIDLSAA